MKEEKNILNSKRGYLNEDFKFFHLKDQKNMQFEFHYHDFNKIVIFISGNVTYLIEGKAYKLKPWDILFVSNNEIHKTLIDDSETYERIVIWINSNFLKEYSNDECNLLDCFELAIKQKFNLLRLNEEMLVTIKYILFQIEDAYKSREFGNGVLRNSLFLQLMVYLNRLFLGMENIREGNDIQYDKNIGAILDYINENLNQDLSIEFLSTKFYMSKYYLMHKFKKQTGYSLHNYILQKRLIHSNILIKKGKPITEVYIECGFGDYSNFLRSFKKMFGLSPKKYYKDFIQIDREYNENGFN